MSDYLYIYEAPFIGHILNTMSLDKQNVHYTGEEVRKPSADGYGVEISFKNPLNFDQFNEKHGGNLKFANNEEFNALYKAHQESLVTDWTEITEERYYDMLEVLPPQNWRTLTGGINIFNISEALTGTLHAHFVKAKNGEKTIYLESTKDVYTKREILLEGIKAALKRVEQEEAPESLGFGHFGNGMTVWNRNEQEFNDHKKVAHISTDREIKYYCELSVKAKREIENFAAKANPSVSVSQSDIKVFSREH